MNQELYQFYLNKLISGDLYLDSEYGFLRATSKWYEEEMYTQIVEMTGFIEDDDRVKTPEFQKALETYRKIPLIAALK